MTNPDTLNKDALEAALDAKLPNGLTIGDFLGFNDADAAELGVLLGDEKPPRLSRLDIVRGMGLRACAEIVLGNAIRAYMAALPDPTPAARESIADVLAERERQKSVEGWTPEHDDGHTAGEMARAAGCYAIASSYNDYQREAYAHDWFSLELLKRWWPWDHKWWKPKDRRRDLVKAGALILAEIERLDRAALTALKGLSS